MILIFTIYTLEKSIFTYSYISLLVALFIFFVLVRYNFFFFGAFKTLLKVT